MVKAILFDLDDTLLWDEKSVNEAFKATCMLAAQNYSINPKILEQRVREHAQKLYPTYDTYPFVKNIGIGTYEALWGEFRDQGESFQRLREVTPVYRREAWGNGLQDVGIDDPDLAEKLAVTFPIERRKHVFVYAETFAVLDQLKGKYPLLLLTNGSPDLQWTKLGLTPELKDYFDHIVISGAFGKGKPDPTIFEHALQLLTVDADEAIMVGDNPNTDILGANQTGIRSVWINHHNKKRDNVVATYEIKDLGEFLPLLNTITVKTHG